MAFVKRHSKVIIAVGTAVMAMAAVVALWKPSTPTGGAGNNSIGSINISGSGAAIASGGIRVGDEVTIHEYDREGEKHKDLIAALHVGYEHLVQSIDQYEGMTPAMMAGMYIPGMDSLFSTADFIELFGPEKLRGIRTYLDYSVRPELMILQGEIGMARTVPRNTHPSSEEFMRKAHNLAAESIAKNLPAGSEFDAGLTAGVYDAGERVKIRHKEFIRKMRNYAQMLNPDSLLGDSAGVSQ